MALEEFLLSIFTELTSEPCIDWDAKTHFGAMKDSVRQDVGKSFFQNILFVIEASELEVKGNLSGEFEEFMIEKRGAALE